MIEIRRTTPLKMSEGEWGNGAGGEEDLSLPKGGASTVRFVLPDGSLTGVIALPKPRRVDAFSRAATVFKLINEMIPANMTCSKETREMLLECCTGNDAGTLDGPRTMILTDFGPRIRPSLDDERQRCF